jgi:hypothetical protein
MVRVAMPAGHREITERPRAKPFGGGTVGLLGDASPAREIQDE